MVRYRLSATAQADVVDILEWTHEQFGVLHDAMELARHLDPESSWK